MLTRFKNSKVKDKLAMLVGVFTLGFVLFALIAFNTLNEIKIQGPYYNRIAAGKDMIADVLPPPLFIVESYVTAIRMTIASSDSEMDELLGRAKRQRALFDERHQFWVNDTVITDPKVKQALLKDAYEPAKAFFEVRDSQFIPAVKRGDMKTANALIRGPLKRYYVQHRSFIDPMIEDLKIANKNVENEADQVVYSRTLWLIFLSVFFIVATSIGAGYGLSRSI
ncbi:hypothetical protein EON80_23850, partial [bacterium]